MDLYIKIDPLCFLTGSEFVHTGRQLPVCLYVECVWARCFSTCAMWQLWSPPALCYLLSQCDSLDTCPLKANITNAAWPRWWVNCSEQHLTSSSFADYTEWSFWNPDQALKWKASVHWNNGVLEMRREGAEGEREGGGERWGGGNYFIIVEGLREIEEKFYFKSFFHKSR